MYTRSIYRSLKLPQKKGEQQKTAPPQPETKLPTPLIILWVALRVSCHQDVGLKLIHRYIWKMFVPKMNFKKYLITNLRRTNPILPCFYNTAMGIYSFLDYVMSLQIKGMKINVTQQNKEQKYKVKSDKHHITCTQNWIQSSSEVMCATPVHIAGITVENFNNCAVGNFLNSPYSWCVNF